MTEDNIVCIIKVDHINLNIFINYLHVGLGVPVGTDTDTWQLESTSTQDNFSSSQNIQSGQVIW